MSGSVDRTPDDVLRRRLTQSEYEGYMIARAARKAEREKLVAEIERLREALRRIESMDADREDEEQADLEWSCADDYYVHRQMMRRIAKEALDA